MQNGQAIPRLRDLPTRSARALTPPLRQRGPRRAIAILGLQFQKAGPVTAETALQTPLYAPLSLKIEIYDLELGPEARPASVARKDRVRKTERTSRSCI